MAKIKKNQPELNIDESEVLEALAEKEETEEVDESVEETKENSAELEEKSTVSQKEKAKEAPAKKTKVDKKVEKLKAKAKRKKEKEKAREEDDDGEPTLRDVFKMVFNSTQKKKPEPIVQKRVKRVKTDYQNGLTQEQVQERVMKGQTNKSPNENVKTIGSIIVENVFTFFNILCFLVAIALVVVNILYKQSWSNILFMAIILVNIIIGIVQEVRAKKTIEKLSLLTAPVVKVVRNGAEDSIAMEDVVIDDIVVLSTGKQIVADCVVVEGNIEVNESVLTGESLPIKKKVGDTLLAGSFVVSGHCHARVEKVGANNYIQQLSSKAKKYKGKTEIIWQKSASTRNSYRLHTLLQPRLNLLCYNR